ncbi:MAG: SgcJ/EcaC family oxidoreductase [Acidobacteriia bacterium]|nr:SgcJ/EcaC family oxidoreductase [Terriglobia bacterium]
MIRSYCQSYSRHFAADGTFTNILGMFFTGHDAFRERHDQIFKGAFRGTTKQEDVVSIRFWRPDVAVVETLQTVNGVQKLFPGTSADAKGRLRTRLLQVFVKNNGEWKIAVYHNVDVKPGVSVPEPQ